MAPSGLDWVTPLGIMASIASIIGVIITFYQIHHDKKGKKYTIALSSANGKTMQLKFLYAALAISIFATFGSLLFPNVYDYDDRNQNIRNGPVLESFPQKTGPKDVPVEESAANRVERNPAKIVTDPLHRDPIVSIGRVAIASGSAEPSHPTNCTTNTTQVRTLELQLQHEVLVIEPSRPTNSTRNATTECSQNISNPGIKEGERLWAGKGFLQDESHPNISANTTKVKVAKQSHWGQGFLSHRISENTTKVQVADQSHWGQGFLSHRISENTTKVQVADQSHWGQGFLQDKSHPATFDNTKEE